MSQPEMLIIVTHNWVLKSVTDYKRTCTTKSWNRNGFPSCTIVRSVL